eukprot:GFUD01042196.1.p1 GENE.GFUD01042196.1~~GFUD01042196.1.p1  ORF type:complete len:313 (+),score=83.48 GFUD01042196.1:54-941(+)
METITKGKLARLSLLQDPAYGVPSDVTFQIIRVTNEGMAEIREVLGDVTGHKLVFAAASPVFRDEFFGGLKETADVIPVKETTYEAFEKMMFFIYSKDIDWSGVTVPEMYDVVNLAEKYIMPELMDEMTKQMENGPLKNNEDLLNIAHTATQFNHLFPDVSSALLLSCAKFLQKTIPPASAQLQFAIDQSGTGKEVTVLQLLSLAKDLPPVQECSNCGGMECLDGQVLVGIDQFTVGMKLRVNKSCGMWGVDGGSYAGQVYIVKSVNKDIKTVNVIGGHFYIVRQNIPAFCYCCS